MIQDCFEMITNTEQAEHAETSPEFDIRNTQHRPPHLWVSITNKVNYNLAIPNRKFIELVFQTPRSKGKIYVSLTFQANISIPVIYIYIWISHIHEHQDCCKLFHT